MRVCNPKSQHLYDEQIEPWVRRDTKILVTFSIIGLPDHAHTCEEKNDQELKHKDLEQHLIHSLHHITDFCWLFLLIFHNLCIISRVDRYTVNVIYVAESSTSQAKLSDINSDNIFKLF